MNEFGNDNVIRELNSDNSFFVKVFAWMFMGLFATGLISYITYSTGFIYNIATQGTWAIIGIIELIVVIVFSVCFRKLSPFFASVLFFVYAIINGITLSSIFVVFELSSIILAFFATALFFGILSLIGYKTNKDLSEFGTIAMVALIVCLIVSIINIFIGATIVDIILNWVVLIIFAVLTMYDVQKIKQYESTMPEKAHIYGAMDLYLDFINIFIRLLNIFGKVRD